MGRDFKRLGLLALTVSLAACSRHEAATMKGDVAEKIARPDGGIAAVTTHEAGDAKTPARFHIYLQMAQNPTQSVEVLDVTNSEMPHAVWLDPTGLRVAVPCGRIRHFSNVADLWSGDDKAHSHQVIVMLDNRGLCPGG